MKFFYEISRLAPYGQPADFFSSPTSHKWLARISLLAVFSISSLPFLAWQHPIFVPTWQSEWYAALSGLLCSAVLLSSEAWRRLTLPFSIVPVALLATIAIGQGVLGYSADAGVSWLYVLEMLWASLLMLSVMRLQPAYLMRSISYGLVTAGVIGGVIGLIQSMRLPVFEGEPALFAQNGLAYGLLAQRNLFADLQSLAIVSLTFLPKPQRATGKLFYYFILVILAASAAASGSNALILYCIFCLIWGAILWRRLPEHARSLLIMVFLAALIGGATFVIRAHVQQVSHVAGASILLTLWHTSLDAIGQHPFWGMGLGNTPQVFYDFASTLPQTPKWAAFHNQGWNNVHNFVLQLWMEAGIPGLLVALLLAGIFLCGAWNATTAEQAWAVALLGILGLHSMVEFPLWSMPFMGLAALLIATISARKELTLASAVGVAPIALAGLVIGLAALSIQMTVQFNQLTKIGSYYFNPRNIIANAEILMSLDKQIKRPGLSAIILRPISTLAQARFPVIAVPKSDCPDAGHRMGTLMKLMPFGYIPYINAQFLALNGHHKESIEATRKALLASPNGADKALHSMQPFLARTPALRPIAELIEQREKNAE